MKQRRKRTKRRMKAEKKGRNDEQRNTERSIMLILSDIWLHGLHREEVAWSADEEPSNWVSSFALQAVEKKARPFAFCSSSCDDGEHRFVCHNRSRDTTHERSKLRRRRATIVKRACTKFSEKDEKGKTKSEEQKWTDQIQQTDNHSSAP